MRKTKFKSSNIEPYWDVIKRVIIESDLVLQILDSRLIDLSRNEKVEELINEINRPFIYVLNKSDLINKKDIELKIEELKKIAPVVFVSNKDSKSNKILLYLIKKEFKKHGKRAPTLRSKDDPKINFREAKADIVIGVIGYPNVGKSSVINSLCHKKKVKVSKKSGTTHGIHWIKLDDQIKILDSPGIIPLIKEDEIRYGLIGAKDSERLKSPDLVANAIIKYALKKNPTSLKKFYNLTLTKDEIDNPDYETIIDKIGKSKCFLLKGGICDENRTVSMIVRDWQHGNLIL
ncbi:hypothetical protein GOV12_04605 [Candidatus Pacearchaeota archaeon]|nr:hypothetical protein [Candidatus Pacearchaeota archaeon]